MIAARAGSRYRGRSVSAETIGDEPFARQQNDGIRPIGFGFLRPRHPILDDVFNRQFFFHTSPPHNVREYSRCRISAEGPLRNPDIEGPRSTTASPTRHSSAEPGVAQAWVWAADRGPNSR